MAPFSEFATHVVVGNKDVPVSAAVAIARSMGNDRVRTTIRRDGMDAQMSDDDDDNNKEEFIAKSLATAATTFHDGSDMRLTPQQLLYLGSVWYLPSEQYKHNNQQLKQQQQQQHQLHHHHNSLHKPVRLSLDDAVMPLFEGDYLRIHHTPRRFAQVYRYDWTPPRSSTSSRCSDSCCTATHDDDDDDVVDPNKGTTNGNSSNDTNGQLHHNRRRHHPPVIVKEGLGYYIINKPPLIPVHATVDNAVENVVYQLQQGRRRDNKNGGSTGGGTTTTNKSNNNSTQQQRDDDYDDDHDIDNNYMAAVQRLDINTSGLLVVATQPEFAAYYAKLLRQKTDHHTTTTTVVRKSNPSISAAVPEDQLRRRSSTNNDAVTSTSSSSNGVKSSSSDPMVNPEGRNQTTAIHKGYRCLVCIQPRDEFADRNGTACETSKESVLQAWQRLARLQHICSDVDRNDASTAPLHRPSRVIRHFTKVSERAPKEFVASIPTNSTENSARNDDQWLECLLYVTKVSPPIPLVPISSRSKGDVLTTSATASLRSPLAAALWPRSEGSVPPNVKAVAEVEISLITGRTHQIRGQLSQLGFAVVGDEQYGGAVPLSLHDSNESSDDGHGDQLGDIPQQQLLALQCCQLSFLDADYETAWNKKLRKNGTQGRANQVGRWVEARLEDAWWTQFLQDYGPDKNDPLSVIDLDMSMMVYPMGNRRVIRAWAMVYHTARTNVPSDAVPICCRHTSSCHQERTSTYWPS